MGINNYLALRIVRWLALGTSLFALAFASRAIAGSNFFKNSDVPRLSAIPPSLARKFSVISPATTAEYHRELNALHIKAVRPGGDTRDPDAPNAANYDPALANPYPRPSQVRREEGFP